MKFEWDETKRRANLEKHGLDFAHLDEFDWTDAVWKLSTGREYGEARYKVMGGFCGRCHTVVMTWRVGRARIISFRKARIQEVKVYEEEKEIRSSRL
jgi:hypothetical protein